MGLNFKYNHGQTPLNEEEKEGLRIRSIHTQGELDEFEQLNIEKAVEWTLHSNIRSEKVLTERFVRDIHKRMFSDVWKWGGEFRKSDKNIGVTWTRIAVELRKLIDDARYWIQEGKMPEEEVAIRFKHRIVSIHCFPNGNGRHSRLMADIIIESIFKKEPFNWHRSSRADPNLIRQKYIRALKEADKGNIELLIDFAKN